VRVTFDVSNLCRIPDIQYDVDLIRTPGYTELKNDMEKHIPRRHRSCTRRLWGRSRSRRPGRINFLEGKKTLALSRRAFEIYLSPGTFGDGSQLVIKQESTTATEQLLRTYGYGYGWFFGDFNSVPIMHHGGGTMGFRNMLARDPARGLYVILLTNRNEADIGFLNEVFDHFIASAE
jgi:hypothetical protein